MRLRVPLEEDFPSRLRGPEVASRVGLWLAVCFAVAFVTGLVSHVAQQPDPVVPLPTRPVWGYRVTQGLHVAAGVAAVPLLLVKLWSVFPRLFARPDGGRPRALAVHGLERLSIAVLVAAAVFQLATGLANSAQWYPWSFSFRATHYAVAWVAVGALVVHIAVKLPVTRRALTGPLDGPLDPPPGEQRSGGPTRRGLLRTTWAATGVALLTTVGGAVPWLRDVSVFATHSGKGPGGVPVNRTARAAGVTAAATAAGFRLEVLHGDRRVSLTRDELAALPQQEEDLPIACVEGWSALGRWRGVRVRDLLSLVDAPARSDVRVVSLQTRGAFARTVLQDEYAEDPLTLLALDLDGEPLSLDHGFPCRVIAPNRPGVLQTKWVTRLEVL